jgi:hypothetical protein
MVRLVKNSPYLVPGATSFASARTECSWVNLVSWFIPARRDERLLFACQSAADEAFSCNVSAMMAFATAQSTALAAGQ